NIGKSLEERFFVRPGIELRASGGADGDQYGAGGGLAALAVVVALQRDERGIVFEGIGERFAVLAVEGRLVDLKGNVEIVFIPGRVADDAVERLGGQDGVGGGIGLRGGRRLRRGRGRRAQQRQRRCE